MPDPADPTEATDDSVAPRRGRPLDALAVGRSILGPRRVPPPPLVEGYEIQGFVAQGGLGHVWRARRLADGCLVAMKVPHQADPELEERLVAEAQALKSLSHPNIVQFEGLLHSGTGLPVLVMEFVEGHTLAEALPDGGFDFGDALQILHPVLDAISHAHSQGILHRDLKPSNLLIAKGDKIKVSDFGLARPVGERLVAFSLTRSGAVAGTVEYLAPECYKPDYVPAPPADIFALGILLYELLTGAPPRGAWRPPSQIKRLDVRLDEVISQAINPDPAHRLPSADSLRKRLEEIRKDRPRYAGTPLVNPATRAIDFAWTCAGLYFCAAGFCSVLAMSRTPVPRVFDLTYQMPGLLIGGWLAVWTLGLGMAVLWLWQAVRLWRFRSVRLRDSVPAPFGLRLGGGKTAGVLVVLTQFLCAWLPVIYTVRIWGLSFHWRTPTTPIWNDALSVVRASDNQTVSAWTWDPVKMFDGGAYRLEQTQERVSPGAFSQTDRTSFYTFIQPALVVASAGVIGMGMTWTLLRLSSPGGPAAEQ